MIEVCAAIIERDGLILTARRKQGSHLAGLWEFPGGKIEQGETPETCLERELQEEFGISAKIGTYIGDSIHDYKNKVICLHAFLVKQFEGQLQLHDHDKILWLAPAELRSVEWAPADIPLVDQYLAIRSTNEYYNRDARAYNDETIALDVSRLYPKFLARLFPNAHILDLGCGSGRDSHYFLQQGYEVTALDQSVKLASLAEQKLDRPVIVKSFSEISDKNEYDGIWANASLLHCPRGQIYEVFSRLIQALKPYGIWFMSFKHGDQECFDEKGRFFNNYTKKSLDTLLRDFKQIEIQNIWEEECELRGRTQRWVNAIVKKCSEPV